MKMAIRCQLEHQVQSFLITQVLLYDSLIVSIKIISLSQANKMSLKVDSEHTNTDIQSLCLASNSKLIPQFP